MRQPHRLIETLVDEGYAGTPAGFLKVMSVCSFRTRDRHGIGMNLFQCIDVNATVLHIRQKLGFRDFRDLKCRVDFFLEKRRNRPRVLG